MMVTSSKVLIRNDANGRDLSSRIASLEDSTSGGLADDSRNLDGLRLVAVAVVDVACESSHVVC